MKYVLGTVTDSFFGCTHMVNKTMYPACEYSNFFFTFVSNISSRFVQSIESKRT